jgi:hypothetical protein
MMVTNLQHFDPPQALAPLWWLLLVLSLAPTDFSGATNTIARRVTTLSRQAAAALIQAFAGATISGSRDHGTQILLAQMGALTRAIKRMQAQLDVLLVVSPTNSALASAFTWLMAQKKRLHAACAAYRGQRIIFRAAAEPWPPCTPRLLTGAAGGEALCPRTGIRLVLELCSTGKRRTRLIHRRRPRAPLTAR